MDERISKIREDVHRKLNFDDYNATMVRKTTCCYSHAIGSTSGYGELYRIGAISGKKNIEQSYSSVDEVQKLLEQDLKVLNLDFKEISNENIELSENQHICKLYVKILRGIGIFDYHFLRFDKDNGWSEKWWGRNVSILDECNIKRYENSSWLYVATYLITR